MTRSRETGDVGYRAYKKNFLINGGVLIDQRNTAVSGGYGPDRWYVNASGTLTRSTSTPKGLPYSLQTVAAGGTQSLRQAIELDAVGNGSQFFKEGNKVTLSLWVKLTAGFDLKSRLVFRDGVEGTVGGGTVSEVIHSGTGEWTQVTNTYDLSGNGPIASNTALVLQLDTLDGSTLNITQAQLEQGSSATPFEYVSPADNLAACQRYFTKTDNNRDMSPLAISGGNEVVRQHVWIFPAEMRVAPTIIGTVSPGVISAVFNSVTSVSIRAVPPGVDATTACAFNSGATADAEL